MILAFMICACTLAIIGFLVKEKKCYNLVAGYNMLQEEEKSKVDIKRLARRMGIMSYVAAMSLFIGGIVVHACKFPESLSVALLFLIIIVGINILIIRGDGKNKVGAQNIIVLAVVDLISLISVVYLFI